MPNKKHDLPNKELLESGFSLFDSFAKKWLELNNKYLEQSKAFMRANIEHAQSLYQTSTPNEFIQKITTIYTENSTFIGKAMLDDMNASLQMCCELCHNSVCGSDEAQKEILQMYDFCSKLMPSPLGNNIDDLVTSTVANHRQSIHAIEKAIEQTTHDLGSIIEENTKTVLSAVTDAQSKSKKTA